MSSTLLPVLLCAALACLAYGDPAGPVPRGYCKMPPPGVMKMARGVDIADLDLCPFEPIGSNGFKSPVIKMKCNKYRPWVNKEGQEYDMPDSVWTINTIPGGLGVSEVRIFRYAAEIRKARFEAIGERKYNPYYFSGSRSLNKMQTLMYRKRSKFAEIEAVDATKRIDFNPPWELKLDNFAQEYLDKMHPKKDYYQDPYFYLGFIYQFGTHYFSKAKFGGAIRVVYETNSEYYTNRTSEQVRKTVYTNFIGVMRTYGDSYLSRGSSTDETGFLKESRQTVKYYGGSANLLAYDGIKKWQPTVDNDPWLTGGVIRPISELIKNDQQRVAMEMAVNNYLWYRYLMYLFGQFTEQRTQVPDADSVEEEFKELMNKEIQDVVEEKVAEMRAKLVTYNIDL